MRMREKMKAFYLKCGALIGLPLLVLAKALIDVVALQEAPDSPDLHGLAVRANWLAAISLGAVVGTSISVLVALESFDGQSRVKIWRAMLIAVLVALVLGLGCLLTARPPGWLW